MSRTDKKPVPLKICPICVGGTISFPARVMWTHIKMCHGPAAAEAWRVANRIAVNKALEKGYAGSTGEVVRALADPGSVLSETLDASGSARPGILVKRTVEVGKLGKVLEEAQPKPRFFSGETCVDVARDAVAAVDRGLRKELKEMAPLSDAPSAPAKAARPGKGEKAAVKQVGATVGLGEDAKEPVKKKKWLII